MSDSTKRELEIKLAFLERHLEEQDKIIHALRKELESLRQRVGRMEERVNASSSSGDSFPHERPPHY